MQSMKMSLCIFCGDYRGTNVCYCNKLDFAISKINFMVNNKHKILKKTKLMIYKRNKHLLLELYQCFNHKNTF